MATLPDVPPSLSWIRHEARSWKKTATQSWWRSAAPERYKELEIPWQDRPKETQLGRAWLGRLVATRTGHGDFTPYHERFGHSGGPWLCLCGRPKTWTHIFFCGKAKRRWRQERGKAPPWSALGKALERCWQLPPERPQCRTTRPPQASLGSYARWGIPQKHA